MAWTLRLSEDKALEDLHGLAEVGVVHEAEPRSWFVTHFQERQTPESYERVKRYRERYRNGECNGDGEVAAGSSTSTSESYSDSVSSEEWVQGEESRTAPRVPAESSEPPLENGRGGEEPRAVPSSPVEAMLHPDVRIYTAVTGGRTPGLSQYRTVIETMRFLRGREKLDDQGLRAYLTPYWLAWSGRKRQDGRPYDPANISWLTEWALNGSVPPNGKKEVAAKSDADAIREVARRVK